MVTTRRTRPGNATARPAQCVIEADKEAAEADKEAKEQIKADEQERTTAKRNVMIERVAALEESMGTPVNQPSLTRLPLPLIPIAQIPKGKASSREDTLVLSDTTKISKFLLPGYDRRVNITHSSFPCRRDTQSRRETRKIAVDRAGIRR